MRCRTSATLLIVALAATGCASWVSVEKVTGDNPRVKGLRYSLATPYLLMKPKADGTVTYEWLFLPDASNEYAISKHSMLSTSSLDITLEHGILKKIIGKPDGSTVAAAVLGQAGTVLAAEETARKKTADAKDTAAKGESDKLKTAVATAEAAQRAAELAFSKAQARRDFLKDQKPVDDKALTEAELALKMAEIDLKAAEEELARAKALLVATGSTNGGANTSEAGLGYLRPLLFRVVQLPNGVVSLRAVHDPANFPDYSQVTSAGTPAGLSFDSVWDAEKKLLVLEATKEVEIVKGRFQLNLGNNLQAVTVTADPEKAAKSWKISFDKSLTAGSYHLQFEYKLGGASKVARTEFEVK